MYTTHIFEYAGGALFKESVQIASEDGQIWWTGDSYAALTLASIFTKLFISLYSIVRICRTNDQSK